MNDIVTIENTEMQIREYNGQRVVTFKDIDRAHQRKNGTARNAFNRNKKHFVRNEDYFVCQTYEAKQLCHDNLITSFIAKKILPFSISISAYRSRLSMCRL